METINNFSKPGQEPDINGLAVNHIKASLDTISHKLDMEIAARQRTVDLQEQEIKRLHLLLEDKNNLLLRLNDKVAECKQNAEGSRQLINKLLNDIERLQQDIEWYKRTYEKRSFLGTIKQKLFNK
jgi:peptidoglycan hydrolase CwlO-like protein